MTSQQKPLMLSAGTTKGRLSLHCQQHQLLASELSSVLLALPPAWRTIVSSTPASTCFFPFFLGYRGIVHPPSDDGGTERTWIVPEHRPRKHFLSDQFKANKMSTLCQLVLTKIPAGSLSSTIHRHLSCHQRQGQTLGPVLLALRSASQRV